MEGRVLSKVKFRTKFPAIPAPPTVAFRSTADETKEPKLLITKGAASVTLASLYDGLSSHGSFWWHLFLANRERGPRAGDPCGARDIATFGSARAPIVIFRVSQSERANMLPS